MTFALPQSERSWLLRDAWSTSGLWSKTGTPFLRTWKLWHQRFWTASSPRNATASTRCSGLGLDSGPTALWRSAAPSQSRSRWGWKFVLRTDHVRVAGIEDELG